MAFEDSKRTIYMRKLRVGIPEAGVLIRNEHAVADLAKLTEPLLNFVAGGGEEQVAHKHRAAFANVGFFAKLRKNLLKLRRNK